MLFSLANIVHFPETAKLFTQNCKHQASKEREAAWLPAQCLLLIYIYRENQRRALSHFSRVASISLR